MSTEKTVSMASDHAGFKLKQALKAALISMGYTVLDRGTNSEERVDYPDFVSQVVVDVKSKAAVKGILICGSGQGMAIAANRDPQIRAALCRDEEDAELTRAHNDANILCLGERKTAPSLAAKIVQKFLSTSFEGGRHAQRVDKLGNISC